MVLHWNKLTKIILFIILITITIIYTLYLYNKTYYKNVKVIDMYYGISCDIHYISLKRGDSVITTNVDEDLYNSVKVGDYITVDNYTFDIPYHFKKIVPECTGMSNGGAGGFRPKTKHLKKKYGKYNNLNTHQIKELLKYENNN